MFSADVLRAGSGAWRARREAVIVYGRLAVAVTNLLTEALAMVSKVRLVAGFIHDPRSPSHLGC
jgi:hypothetical protein